MIFKIENNIPMPIAYVGRNSENKIVSLSPQWDNETCEQLGITQSPVYTNEERLSALEEMNGKYIASKMTYDEFKSRFPVGAKFRFLSGIHKKYTIHVIGNIDSESVVVFKYYINGKGWYLYAANIEEINSFI